ncbi:MAG: DUF2884 family protein [Rhodanobacteraceae bacterium]
MNRILIFTGSVLFAIALAACSPGIHTLGNSITFDSNGMVVHAPGRPNAHVDRNGELSIDGKAVAVTPAQRRLLQRYYQQAHETMDSAKSMGERGVQIATHSIGAAIASIFHDGPSPAEKKLDAESDQIEAAADQMCADVKALGVTQKAIADGVPAFAPYASHARFECTATHSTAHKVNGAKSSSFTYALRESNGSDATTSEASSRQATPSVRSSAATSSRP